MLIEEAMTEISERCVYRRPYGITDPLRIVAEYEVSYLSQVWSPRR